MREDLVASRISGSNSEYGRVSSDFYPTPPEATQVLVDFLNLADSKPLVWEPACGEGHMVEVFTENGIPCTGTDLKNGQDFLTSPCIPCDWIITNPPFSIAEDFIRQSILHGKPFAFLLKAHYWNAKKRLSLFREHPPAYVLPLTWRPDFLFKSRGKGSPLMDVMWVVWDASPSKVTQFIPLEKPGVKG